MLTHFLSNTQPSLAFNCMNPGTTTAGELCETRTTVIEYLLSREGQQAVLDAGFAPLTAEILEEQRKKLFPDYKPAWHESPPFPLH